MCTLHTPPHWTNLVTCIVHVLQVQKLMPTYPVFLSILKVTVLLHSANRTSTFLLHNKQHSVEKVISQIISWAHDCQH